MINQLAEGMALDKMHDYVSGYDKKYKYSFVERGSAADKFLKTLHIFRYCQMKLTNDKKNKADLYPRQLISLARYYYYEENKDDIDAVRSRMIRWVTDLYNELSLYADLERNTLLKFIDPVYSLPFFDNEFPLEAVIREAVLAGPLPPPEYPSPEGLTMRDGSVFQFHKDSTEESKKKQTEEFWLRQLNALYADWQALQNRKATEKKEQDEIPEKKEEVLTSLRLPPSVETAFLVALWYARCFQEQGAEKKSRYFHYEKYYMMRTFMSLSSDSRLSGIFEENSKFFVNIPAGKLNTMGCVY